MREHWNKHAGHIRQRNGRWQARFPDRARGGKHKIERTFNSRDEAEVWLAKARAGYAETVVLDPLPALAELKATRLPGHVRSRGGRWQARFPDAARGRTAKIERTFQTRAEAEVWLHAMRSGLTLP
jgi:hypothetical protein